MLNTALHHLDSLQISYELEPAFGPWRADAVLEIRNDGRRHRFFVETKARPPFPSELDHFVARREPTEGAHWLLVSSYVSRSLGALLTRHGWSWLDELGNFDIRAPGLLLRQRETDDPPKKAARRLPLGHGSLAIIRFLISHGSNGPLRTSYLAKVAGVRPAGASQIMSQLRGLELAERTPNGWEASRDALLDALLDQYPGPRGSELFYYSLDSPLDVALTLARTATPFWISADIGPDLITPWRRPADLVVYFRSTESGKWVAPQSFTPAKSVADANIIVRHPDDRSVFCSIDHTVQVHGEQLHLVEHTQMIWDLLQLGGDDRQEAANRLRQWLLSR